MGGLLPELASLKFNSLLKLFLLALGVEALFDDRSGGFSIHHSVKISISLQTAYAFHDIQTVVDTAFGALDFRMLMFATAKNFISYLHNADAFPFFPRDHSEDESSEIFEVSCFSTPRLL